MSISRASTHQNMQPTPPPFKESARCAEQNLYVRGKELVGDRDPRAHEFSLQLRAFDSAKSGSAVSRLMTSGKPAKS